MTANNIELMCSPREREISMGDGHGDGTESFGELLEEEVQTIKEILDGEKPKRKPKPKNDDPKGSGCSCLSILLTGFFALFILVVLVILSSFLRIRDELPEIERQIALVPYDEVTDIKAVGWIIERPDRGVEITIGIIGEGGPVNFARNNWQLELVTAPSMSYESYSYDDDDHDLGILNLVTSEAGIHRFSSIYNFHQSDDFEYTFWFVGPEITTVAETIEVYLRVRLDDGTWHRQQVELLDRVTRD